MRPINKGLDQLADWPNDFGTDIYAFHIDDKSLLPFFKCVCMAKGNFDVKV